MTTLDGQLKFRKELKSLTLEELYKKKENLEAYSKDKQQILTAEIIDREKSNQEEYNQEILECAREANIISKKSKKTFHVG
ncbi:hypothetical protein [Legionella jordanis]|uniref:Uncharacterized protein n=1 Tax=Legionella jordanis TaxID=456 RepID=A0A0W0V8H8_9GAMM|nr:hypothetical protein [Legionella jordanis]KTD16394.1 hypothetical protein Ljor_0700 [Legionella jordanis]RMX04403.1 hypothetical protein EAW55_02905 [Legionella jordanis]RMX15594.1 hypothetical protein EAS68_12100 [Legionella jordanis]VEH12145.1 Uncharacterised protein [Legionella jordanis]